MAEPAETTFETETAAGEFCRLQEMRDERRWIKWQLPNGRWQVAQTSLAKPDPPGGEVAEARPKPAEGTDPSIGRAGGPPIWAGG
jgi:hypothetical protein